MADKNDDTAKKRTDREQEVAESDDISRLKEEITAAFGGLIDKYKSNKALLDKMFNTLSTGFDSMDAKLDEIDTKLDEFLKKPPSRKP